MLRVWFYEQQQFSVGGIFYTCVYLCINTNVYLKFDFTWILFLCHYFDAFNDIRPVFESDCQNGFLLFLECQNPLNYELFLTSYVFCKVQRGLS